MLPDPLLDERVAAVRRFNRYYTRRIGVLNEALLGSAYSLAEMRVLWEIANAKDGVSSSQLEDWLNLDKSYLSRILARFRKQRLLETSSAGHDARMKVHRITRKGQQQFALLDRRSGDEVRASLRALDGAAQHRLTAAMAQVEDILEGRSREPGSLVTLRTPHPGDFGWVVERHGALYAKEYGFDATFEALIAEIVAQFIRGFDPRRERAWIAEQGGERIGSVFLVRRSATVAKLRLLLVEPTARGSRVGSQLVAECIQFARTAGYRRIVLWTQNILHSARHIYERAGFKLVGEEDSRLWGCRLRSQTWALTLKGPEK